MTNVVPRDPVIAEPRAAVDVRKGGDYRDPCTLQSLRKAIRYARVLLERCLIRMDDDHEPGPGCRSNGLHPGYQGDRETKALLRAQGARLGWLIDPLTGKVEVYRPGREPEVLDRPRSLSGEDVLPGFSLDLTEILAR